MGGHKKRLENSMGNLGTVWSLVWSCRVWIEKDGAPDFRRGDVTRVSMLPTMPPICTYWLQLPTQTAAKGDIKARCRDPRSHITTR